MGKQRRSAVTMGHTLVPPRGANKKLHIVRRPFRPSISPETRVPCGFSAIRIEKPHPVRLSSQDRTQLPTSNEDNSLASGMLLALPTVVTGREDYRVKALAIH